MAEHSQAQDAVGTLATALAHTQRLLATSPARAEEQAQEILHVVPGHPDTQFFLGVAQRLQGKVLPAKNTFEVLLTEQPHHANARYELGLVYAELGDPQAAIAALQQATSLNPKHSAAWRALGDQLTLTGDIVAADDAYSQHLKSAVNDPQLMEAAVALCDNKLAVAERLLKDFLKAHPTDVGAIRMLAELATRLGRYEDAENLLSRCLELMPSFNAARHNYAIVLYRQNKAEQTIDQLGRLLETDPRNVTYRNLQAATHVRVGDYDKAIETYAEVLKDYPQHALGWMSYGHALKTIGRQADSIEAYRKSIKLKPNLGEAYWSLANLKTFRFNDDDVKQIRTQLETSGLGNEDEFHLHFTLGKVLEDIKDYAQSFEQYALGNQKRRTEIDYKAEEASAHVQRSQKLFTKTFFENRRGQGSQAPDPIFIVGLPRSGSTLVEQILSSHSQVEGTMELPDIIAMSRRIGGRKKRGEETNYPEALADLTPEQLQALGEEFLNRTRIQRREGKAFFIDKMPNNFLHTGFIHLILPNAKIIDARRHPMGCCFSGFKQHFARGQNFSYSLEDIGRYYHDYVALMAHYDAVLPGHVHRVIYEQMVSDTEAEIRKLLQHCGLEFEEQCLRYHENNRAVRTASSEQVRKPIFKDGVDQWQNYAPWLEPLKAVLGPVLETYPAVPETSMP